MNPSYNDDELEAWLAQVEDAHKTIMDMKDDKLSVQEFDRKQQIKEARKKREQEEKEQKERELLEKKKRGREGKGNNPDYKNFCKLCFLEYELETPNCMRCNKPTQTREQRIEYLMGKVNDYKENKLKKEERKKKWELWQKTQAMLWKKTSTNYSKWEYFASSSEEEENKDPIVPKNDPNFMAMEADMNKRAEKRKADKKKADELKARGNQRFAEGDYEKAVLWYSEALDLVKDIKPLWTNRALAWIKLGYFKKAIKDCTRILEYCECFEDGYTQSRDACFKAFLRRAVAHKERKNLKEAMDDVQECLKLYPNDKEAKLLQNEVEEMQKQEKTATEIHQKQISLKEKIQKNKDKQEYKEDQKVDDNDKENQEKVEKQEQKTDQKSENPEIDQKQQNDNKTQPQSGLPEDIQQKIESKIDEIETQLQEKELSYLEQVDKFMNETKYTPKKIEKFQTLLLKNPDAKVYFFEKKGSQKLVDLLKENHKVYLLLTIFLNENIHYMNTFLKNGGGEVLFEKVRNYLKIDINEKENEDQEIEKPDLTIAQVDELAEIFEILVTLVLQDTIRNSLSNDKIVQKMLKIASKKVIYLFQQHPFMVGNFVNLLSNMCYQDSQVKKCFENEKDLGFLMNTIYLFVSNDQNGIKFEFLREHTCNLLVNFLSDSVIRVKFQNKQYRQILEVLVTRLSSYNLVKNNAYIEVALSTLAVFVNMVYQCNKECQSFMSELKVGEVIYNKFLSKLPHKEEKYKEIMLRSLSIVAKIDFNQSQNLIENNIMITLLNFFDEASEKFGFSNKAIIIYHAIFSAPNLQGVIIKKQPSFFEKLIPNLKSGIKQDELLRFCNSCTVAGQLVLLLPQYQEQFQDLIERLIYICKEKVDQTRKNAAQLLAKLAKSEKNMEKIRSLHGMDVLRNIAKFIM